MVEQNKEALHLAFASLGRLRVWICGDSFIIFVGDKAQISMSQGGMIQGAQCHEVQGNTGRAWATTAEHLKQLCLKVKTIENIWILPGYGQITGDYTTRQKI